MGERQVVDVTGAREIPPEPAPAEISKEEGPVPLEHRLAEQVMAAGLDWSDFKRLRLGGSKGWADWVKLCRGDEQAAYDRAVALLPR